MALKLRDSEIQIRNALKVFRCGAGKGWRSVRQIV
jgi:hypothetical protein